MPRLPIGDMGPCEIVWKYGESGAIELGPFLDGVKLRASTSVHDVKTDRTGDVAVDAGFGGTVYELETPMVRSTLEQLSEVLLSGDPVVSGDHEYIYLKNQIGCFMYDLASALVIKPICGNDVSIDPAQWTHLYKCYPVPALDLSWAPATQRIFPVTWKVFVSQESGYEGKFGTMGMESGSLEFGI